MQLKWNLSYTHFKKMWFAIQKLLPTFAPGNFKPFLSIALLRLKHGII
jgi:hypothetical protein